LALFGGPGVLRSTHQDALIDGGFGASVLTLAYTHIVPRAALALHAGQYH